MIQNSFLKNITPVPVFLLEETEKKFEKFLNIEEETPYDEKNAFSNIGKLVEEALTIVKTKSISNFVSDFKFEIIFNIVTEIKKNGKVISDWAEKKARDWERGEILSRGNHLLKTSSGPEDKFPNGVERHLIVFKKRFFLVKTGGVRSEPFATESRDQMNKVELIKIIEYLLREK